MHGTSSALKGHNMKAWGIAPGKRFPQIHPALKGRHNTSCSAPSGLPRFVILNPGRCPGLSYPALSGLNAHEETQRLATIDQRKLAALDDLKKSLLHQAFNGGTVMHGMSSALKGHNAKAWGIAPGKRFPQNPSSPERATQHDLFRPFRAPAFCDSKPRALPWAGISRPFRAQRTRRNPTPRHHRPAKTRRTRRSEIPYNSRETVCQIPFHTLITT